MGIGKNRSMTRTKDRASCIVDAQVPLISINGNKSGNSNNDCQPSRASFEGIHFYMPCAFHATRFSTPLAAQVESWGKKCCILRRTARPSAEIQFALFKTAVCVASMPHIVASQLFSCLANCYTFRFSVDIVAPQLCFTPSLCVSATSFSFLPSSSRFC